VKSRALANWLQDYLDEMWDRQIEADLASGKLAPLIADEQRIWQPTTSNIPMKSFATPQPNSK
jgi:hypothetical protein